MFIKASYERVDVPGLLGHLICDSDEDEKKDEEAGGGYYPNCVVVLIPDATPLICVVATSKTQR